MPIKLKIGAVSITEDFIQKLFGTRAKKGAKKCTVHDKKIYQLSFYKDINILLRLHIK